MLEKCYMNQVKLSMKVNILKIETLGLIIQVNLNIYYMDSTVARASRSKNQPTQRQNTEYYPIREIQRKLTKSKEP